MVVLGTEQEYGITLVGADPLHAPDPMHLSNLVVRGYRDATTDASVGFDYASESPLDDQWGFQLSREEAHPDLRTDELVMANRMLTNGSRLYVDHAHPELSGPETTSPLEAVRYDRAGDLIMQAAVEAVRTTGPQLRLFKNNTDSKGQSYGTHENYLVSRSVPFDDIVAGIVPWLVCRGVLCGAGRVGLGRCGEQPGFQLMQRGDFFEREVGIETTMRRPLVNTRDEPHADRNLARRLHVITGDATIAQVGTWLRLGATSLVLRLVAEDQVPDLRLADPVRAFRDVSYGVDPESGAITSHLPLADGRTASPLDVAGAYLDAVPGLDHLTDEDRDLLDCWAETLDLLRTNPMACADRIDWVAKLRLLQGFRARDGLAWGDPRLAAIDLQYAEIDPARGLALRLERSGSLIRLHEPEETQRAVVSPPETTRAWLRGELLRRCGTDVVAMGWDSATVRTSTGRHVRLDLSDPLRGSRADAGDLLDRAACVEAVAAAFAGAGRA